MIRIKVIIAIVALSISIAAQAQKYPTRLLDNESQIENIIKGMTLEEKVAMLHGKNMFSSAGIERLGIADIEYADGPFGIREEMEPHSWNSANLTTDSATFFPTGSALAATWSTEWAYAYGRGMSREARLRGKDMILGPAINIQRIPTGGRTYEYLSEDPMLSGALAVAYTRGAQDDVTAVCLLMDRIRPHKIAASPVATGNGTVRSAHGILPVPAPATANILEGIPSYSGEIRSELCTPTGAALLKYFVDEFGDMPEMQVEKCGYGMGAKDFERANCVRISLGEVDYFSNGTDRA